MRGSWRIGRIAGIEVGIHYTLAAGIIYFRRVCWGRAWHNLCPGWSASLLIAGFLATFSVFVSVLIHWTRPFTW